MLKQLQNRKFTQYNNNDDIILR